VGFKLWLKTQICFEDIKWLFFTGMDALEMQDETCLCSEREGVQSSSSLLSSDFEKYTSWMDQTHKEQTG